MSNFSNFSGIEKPVGNYSAFWDWFVTKEKEFFKAVENDKDIELDLFEFVYPKLEPIKDGLFLIAGMVDDNTAELIFSPGGSISNIVFAEEIVAAAPDIDGWKFTACKPEANKGFTLKVEDILISEDSLYFFEKPSWDQPDNVELVVIHRNLNEDNQEQLGKAIYVFLDNYLGELFFTMTIDGLNVNSYIPADQEFMSLSELKTYLEKRQAEIDEKYDISRTDTDNDPHSLLEAEFDDGSPLNALVNTALLKWENKPSHPWIAKVNMGYIANEYGMPDEETYARLQQLERELIEQLPDHEGYLAVVTEMGNGIRSIGFACKEFRKPSKVMHAFKMRHGNEFDIEFGAYKDKYWQSFDRFIVAEEAEFVN